MLPDGGGYGYNGEAAGHAVGILHTSRGPRVPNVLGYVHTSCQRQRSRMRLRQVLHCTTTNEMQMQRMGMNTLSAFAFPHHKQW